MNSVSAFWQCLCCRARLDDEYGEREALLADHTEGRPAIAPYVYREHQTGERLKSSRYLEGSTYAQADLDKIWRSALSRYVEIGPLGNMSSSSASLPLSQQTQPHQDHGRKRSGTVNSATTATSSVAAARAVEPTEAVLTRITHPLLNLLGDRTLEEYQSEDGDQAAQASARAALEISAFVDDDEDDESWKKVAVWINSHEVDAKPQAPCSSNDTLSDASGRRLPEAQVVLVQFGNVT